MKKIKSTEEGAMTFIEPKIARLDVTFNSEDMNKVVEKINEIIENQ